MVLIKACGFRKDQKGVCASDTIVLQFGCLLWCLTYLGSWFNGLTLVILAVVALFTLPKVYEQNQAQIDQYVGLVRTQVNDVMSK